MLGRPASCEAGLEKRDRRIVIDGLGVHRLDEAQLVRDLRRVRHQLADPRAGLAVLRELNSDGATGKLVCVAVMPVSRWPCRIESGSSVARRSLSFGLWSNRSICDGAPGLEKVDDALGLGREVRQAGHPALCAQILLEQRCERGHPQARAGSFEEVPSRHHSFVTVSSRLRIRLATVV